jgi:hypothetical protein
MRQYLNIMERAEVVFSPAFQAWFGGSKVIDSVGNPLVCYHGTFRDFSEFKHHAFGTAGSGFNRLGFWFDVNPDTANSFAGYEPGADYASPGANVKPCYLSIQKPYVIEGDWLWDEDLDKLRALRAAINYTRVHKDDGGHHLAVQEYKALNARLMADDAWSRVMSFLPNGVKSSTAEVAAFQQKLIDGGYDGIKMVDTLADGGTRDFKPTDWWIAFRPNQIKSVFNQNVDRSDAF